MPVKFTDNSEKFFNDLDKGIVRGIRLGDEILVRNIGNNTPVVLGNLKSKTQPTATIETSNGFKGGVQNNAEYAAWVEYGGGTRKLKSGKTITVFFQPRAMFRKGGDESAEPVLNLIKKSLPK